MKKGTAFIQPHSDDVVMSMYYAIKSRLLPEPYFLITAFSESDWIDPVQRVFLEDSHKTLTKNSITELRKLEDKEFAVKCDMECIFLNMPDCKLRSGGAVFEPAALLDQNIALELHSRLIKVLSEIQVNTIVFPYPSAERQHIDHRILLDVCNQLQDYSRYVSDDLPYSRIKNMSMAFVESKFFADTLLEKFKMMSIYKTQMNSYFYEDVSRLHCENGNAERLFKII